MNPYQIPSPRKAFAAAAVAMTAITLALAVLVPARVGSPALEVRTLAPIDVVARPSSIDVVGDRDPEVVQVQVHTPVQKPKQES
jgi:hypothetical protein